MRGLTTAASLWAVAAVGLAVGGGLYVASVATTLIVLIILAGMKPIEEHYQSDSDPASAAGGTRGRDVDRRIAGSLGGALLAH